MIIYPLPTFWLCKVKLKTFITVRSRVQETEQNSGSCDSLWGYLWLHTGQLALPFSLFLAGISRPCPSHCISIDPTSTLPSALPPTCCASSYFCSQSMNSQRPEAEGGNVPIPPLPFFCIVPRTAVPVQCRRWEQAAGDVTTANKMLV